MTDKKKFAINVLISVGLWLGTWIISCAADYLISPSSDNDRWAPLYLALSLIVAVAAVSAASALMIIYRKTDVAFFPTVTLVLNALGAIAITVTLIIQTNNVFASVAGNDALGQLLALFGTFGMIFISACLIVFMNVLMLVYFGVSIVASMVTNKIIGKNIPIIYNDDNETKGRIQND